MLILTDNKQTTVLKKAMQHCKAMLRNSRCYSLPYHNMQHTLEVFQYARKISDYEKLSCEDKEMVSLASLFHDTGNSEIYKGHEKISAKKAHCFLSSLGYSEEKIERVKSCIVATQMPQTPSNKLEEVICDADLAHLGSNSFINCNRRLRLEWNKCFNKSFSDKEWLENNIIFLESHSYFTSYGKEILHPKKMKNLELLQEAYQKLVY